MYAPEKTTSGNPPRQFLPIDDKSNVFAEYVLLDFAEEAPAREVDANGPPTVVVRTLAICGPRRCTTPSYTSSLAMVSGACSKMQALCAGSDEYGFAERRKHCELTEKDADTMVTLEIPTGNSTAEMAALSQALGGYHIAVDNEVGIKVGREIAAWS